MLHLVRSRTEAHRRIRLELFGIHQFAQREIARLSIRDFANLARRHSLALLGVHACARGESPYGMSFRFMQRARF